MLNKMNNVKVPRAITFYCGTNVLARSTAHVGMISITQNSKLILTTPELTAIATGGFHDNVTPSMYWS